MLSAVGPALFFSLSSRFGRLETMPILLGVDLGTTKITAIALDAADGTLLEVHGKPNTANVTSAEDRQRDRSEWDPRAISRIGVECLRGIAEALGDRRSDVAAIGVTGQQHGVLLTDAAGHPVTPLINWQDRRGLDRVGAGLGTYLDLAREHIGSESLTRTGCRLHPGFMAVTLFWMLKNGGLPGGARTALFLMDYFCAELTGGKAVTEPTCAGSAGLLNYRLRDWDGEAIRALGLPRGLFPDVVEADRPIGQLTAALADATGLPAGIPVSAPLGDHQACFVGSVAERQTTALVNVGTGAQAAVYVDSAEVHPPVEVRPFPLHGNLQSNVGLAGGWAYQTLEKFFRDVVEQFAPGTRIESLYGRMNELAAGVPHGAHGVSSVPTFSGTRSDPTVRGRFQGISPANFTAADFSRAVIEGMARSLSDGFRAAQDLSGRRFKALAAAGNGLRENALLAGEVEQASGLPLRYTRHREEAAFGAALVAGVAAGVFPSLDAAGALVQYE